MKTTKFTVLGLFLVLAALSCKKTDFDEELTTAAGVAATAAAADTVGWRVASNWIAADQEAFSVHYITIEDDAITSDIADNGLVLLFKRNGGAINALPFEESVSGSAEPNYWYHQVAEGSLLISCDAYGKAGAPDAASSFKYFVVTPEKLSDLETNGITTEKLVALSYEEAAALLSAAG